MAAHQIIAEGVDAAIGGGIENISMTPRDNQPHPVVQEQKPGIYMVMGNTAEVVAQYLFEQIASHFTDQGLSVLVARVWESPQAYASFEGPLG